MGSVEPLKALHARWGDEVTFLDVLVRQAHPGPGARPYRSLGEKMRDAARYRREDDIDWPVLVDGLDGTVHQRYGGLADPTYLIDADGNVAFYNLWTHAPTLDRAIRALVARGGRGVVQGGVDRTPHVLPAMTDGWRGLRRGAPQSVIDLETAAPGSASGPWLGHQLRPLLAPITLRSEPLPLAARVGLTIGAVGAITVAYLGLRRFTR